MLISKKKTIANSRGEKSLVPELAATLLHCSIYAIPELFQDSEILIWRRCFSANFAKFLRPPFLTEHLRWLLLYDGISNIYDGDFLRK